MRRLLSACLLSILVLFTLSTPVQADRGGDDDGHDGNHDRGDVFSVNPFDDDYSFTDDCGFDVEGHASGVETLYNVPGSDGQAFLLDSKFRFKEVWSNGEGGTATASGKARFRETAARHVEGNIWEFTQVLKGRPLTVRDSEGKVVLSEHGQVTFKTLFDTLGDGQPGGEEIEEKIVKIRGDFPTLDPDFDFCAFADEVLG